MVQFNVPNCFSGDCDCKGAAPPSAFCPYGDCFSCIPSKCIGPKCCCCVSLDIVLGIRARCYDRVYFSCNIDGTSPGPGKPPFSQECSQCFEACNLALGGDSECSNIYNPISPPDWWTFPPSIGPCSCECKEFVDPENPELGCNLTCVTCSGLQCNADVEVLAGNCSYQFNLTPGTGCCGTPAIVDVVFVIDYSGSMTNNISNVIDNISRLTTQLSTTGALARFGLVVYGKRVNDVNEIKFSNGEILTTDLSDFKKILNDQLPVSGGVEASFKAVEHALITYPWSGVENILFLIGDESAEGGPVPPALPVIGGLGDPETQPTSSTLISLSNRLGVTVHVIQPQNEEFSATDTHGHDSRKTDLAVGTNGQDIDILTNFFQIIDDLNINVFASSCDCLDLTPIPLELCTGGTGVEGNECIDPDINIPIKKCIEEDNSDCRCNEPMIFNVCGEIVVVTPDPSTTNLVCCGEIEGGGCSCPSTNDPAGCCGLSCSGIDICVDFQGSTLENAINTIWCECWQKGMEGEFIIETPGCSRCIVPDPDDPDFDSLDIDAIKNCSIKIPDGMGGFVSKTRSEVVSEVEAAWAACDTPEEIVPPSISEASCLPIFQPDECIAGNTSCSDTEDIRECRRTACSSPEIGTTSIRNPDVAILNNGIGLVAYESMEDISVIKIDQLNTSIPAKILPNRKTNYGRLQNDHQWTDSSDNNLKLVKLYYFSDISSHFINGVISSPTEGSLKDTLVFQNGPLQNQCFSLYGENPIGTDDIGAFIQFVVPKDYTLSNPFPNSDDVYNIEWFIIDSDDTGLIGSAVKKSDIDIPGSDFSIDVSGVNQILQLNPHIHDGKSVPVANPSLASAHNYMNAIENSHYVYLVYQALEDNKWNIYLRQIRLSEYSRETQINPAVGNFVSLLELNVDELIYRVICTNDECLSFGDNFLAKRVISLEVTLKDGREVFNEGLLDSTESWTICSGSPAGQFIKKKVFVEFSHSVLLNKCPDQFEFNEIFYNWDVGDEFSIPFKKMNALSLFTLLKKNNDNAIALGETTVEVSGITITSSQVGAIWFDDPEVSTWVTANSTTFTDLSKFKGIDISEPIPITEFEEGHCTHPVVKVNSNNEVYVVYECTDPLVHQIHITGTAIPSSSLPLGIFEPKNLDATLDYFLAPDDFKYKSNITISEGVNQLPAMYIDVNDVIHICWQSNRDDFWEIYYANSSNAFIPKRITDFKSKSLKPSIAGDKLGNLHIVWHDNRFGNWEILMAYRDDERIPTLFEQDPYLAGIRNPGYTHVTDIIPLTLINTSISDSLCISDLTVRFFEDRFLTNAVFDVSMTDFPVAFQIPGSQDDRTTIIWTYTEIDWTLLPDQVQIGSTKYDHYEPTERSMDSSLIGSSFDTVNMVFGVQPQFIRFLASPYANEHEELDSMKKQAISLGQNPDILTLEDTNWIKDISNNSNWIKVSDFVSGDTRIISDLADNFFATAPFVLATGRYKRVEILLNIGDSFNFDSISVVSVKKNRLCLAPQEKVVAFLDLTPSIRLDKSGNNVVETPLPIKARKNIVYFTSVIGITDSGQIHAFPDLKQSVSCETCIEDNTSWNAASCVFTFKFQNFNDPAMTRFYNARVRFYTDQTKENLVAQFDAFNDVNGNLEYFTLDDNQKAQDIWQKDGFEVFAGQTRNITLWPMLSNTSGLLCGLRYWVETSICFGTEKEPCSRSQLGSKDIQDTSLDHWICNCSSTRWSTKFGDAPVNIRDIVRWKSSGDGFADTRLTETNVNNLNPVIRVRNDLTGIVIYESNRDQILKIDQDNDKYTLYAAAFSVFPGTNMYSTGTEAITSNLSNILVQSDIPLNECSIDSSEGEGGCDDCDSSNSTCKAMEGRNVSFDLDQYGNLFLATERQNDQTQCEDFQKDRQKSLIIHRGGVRAKNLIFAIEEKEGSGTIECLSTEILKKTAPLSQDKVFKKIIKMARVKNKFTKYHITRSNKPVAIVDQCDIEIEVITEPGTIAIRLQNENESWSTWYPFSSQLGEYTMSIPWKLSFGSGIKTVTIEAATYQGISTTFTISIVADYRGVNHVVKFYKLQNAPIPGENVTNQELIDLVINNSQAFDVQNLLPQPSGLPVAGIRHPTLDETNNNPKIVHSNSEFIFIEIIPSGEYLKMLGNAIETRSPNFDVLQQGTEDIFSVPTIFNESNGSFRGAFVIKKDNKSVFRDGLSFIIPHFVNDCSDNSLNIVSEHYIRDKFNIAVSKDITTTQPNDIFAEERDKLGQIKYPITIRGIEDPYFVFGEPNYRTKKQDS